RRNRDTAPREFCRLESVEEVVERPPPHRHTRTPENEHFALEYRSKRAQHLCGRWRRILQYLGRHAERRLVSRERRELSLQVRPGIERDCDHLGRRRKDIWIQTVDDAAAATPIGKS